MIYDFQSTTTAEFKRRGTFIRDLGKRYITENENKKEGKRKEEFILRYKGRKMPKYSGDICKTLELFHLKGYHVHLKPKLSKINERPHFHLYK